MISPQDQAARTKALDPLNSFIVQAPAGSGKTELLTQRYLNLLSVTPQSPEEIIAITFTKKAAAEMRERILESLNSARHDEPQAPHKKTTWHLAKKALERDNKEKWNLLSNPNRLRIMTIDSLALTINQFAPLLGELGSQPKIAEDASELYRLAASQLLESIEHPSLQSSLSSLLMHLDNKADHVIDLLSFMLSKREQWLPYVIGFAGQQEDLQHSLESSLTQLLEDICSAINLSLDTTDKHTLFSALNTAGQYLQEKDPDNPLAILHTIKTDTVFTRQNMDLCKAVTDTLLTSQGNWRKTVTTRQGFASKSDHKEMMLGYLKCASENHALQCALLEFRNAPAERYQPKQWKMLKDLTTILPYLVANLRLVMQQHATIDFSEITLAALRALGSEEEPTDLALYMDYKIQHLLIDEFQDTSATQFYFFKRLLQGWMPGDNKTLFLVGDPMQSIYRFRNAEVSLFLKAKEQGINQIRLTFLELCVNFRSTSTIVNWVNSTFSHVFPSSSDNNSGAITYAPSTASNQSEGSINYLVSHNDDNILHSKICEVLKNIPKNESVAILVRSRNQLKKLTLALHEHKIIFNAVDIDPLSNQEEIKDCVSLTRALLHFADDIAWYSCLRAPWCGLSLSDLYLISQHNTTTVWDTLRKLEKHQHFSQDGKNRVNSFVNVISGIINERGQSDFHELVERAWKKLGGEKLLTSKSQSSNVDRYFDLLQEIEKKYNILTLSRIESDVKKLYSNTQSDQSNVHIMTIHKSKGLEFDHVILPHLESKSGNTDNSLLQWLERVDSNGCLHLLLAPIKSSSESTDSIYQYLKYSEKLKLENESARLFYVACTRAKKSLFLCAALSTKQDSTTHSIKPPLNSSHLGLIWPILESNFSNQPIRRTENVPTINRPNFKLKKLKLEHLACVDSPPLNINDYSGKPPRLIRETLQDQKPRIIGTIIHKALERIANEGLLSWEDLIIKKLPQSWERQLKQEQIYDQLSVQRIIDTIRNTLSCSRGQWILSNCHPFSASEFHVSFTENTEVKHVFIDRVIVDKESVWIIDFKTSQPCIDQDTNEFIQVEVDTYRSQLKRYKDAINSIFQLPTRCILYFPLCETKWVEVDTERQPLTV